MKIKPINILLAFGVALAVADGESVKRFKLYRSKMDNRDSATLAEEYFYHSNGRDSIQINYEDDLGRVFYSFYDSTGCIQKNEARFKKSDSLYATIAYKWITKDSAFMLRTVGENLKIEWKAKFCNLRYDKFGEMVSDTIKASEFKVNGISEIGWSKNIFEYDSMGYVSREIYEKSNYNTEYYDTTLYLNIYENKVLVKYVKKYGSNDRGKYYFYEYESTPIDVIPRRKLTRNVMAQSREYYKMNGQRIPIRPMRNKYFEKPAK